MLTENGSSMFIGSPVMLIPRSVSHHRPGIRDDQPFQYDTNERFSIENESLLFCSLAVISLRIPWDQPTRYATRYEQANRKGEGCPFDPLSGRREEEGKEGKEGKRETKIDRPWQKVSSLGKRGVKMGRWTLSTETFR